MGLADIAQRDDLLSRLEAAAIDGRARNIRYRQNQLHLLHKYLRDNADALCSAIMQDEDVSQEEAELEYYLSMTTINEIYEQLNFENDLEEEYAVTKLKNNVGRRVPHGIVLLRPGMYTRLFSLVAPLVAALGAGNCVLVEMPPSFPNLDSLLCEGLEFLDHDVCGISAQSVTNEAFLSNCIIVDQSQVSRAPPAKQLESSSQRLAIAIVNRTADIEEAATAVTTARCAFGGQSPHSPDVVLVNEFVKQDFVEACLRRMTAITAALASKSTTGSSNDFLESMYTAEKCDMIFSSNKVNLLELHRGQHISSQKISSRALVIAPVTGLVDALTAASRVGPFAACYCFGDVKSAKFVSQHIDSKVVFVNQIPAHWLVGPAFPDGLANLDPKLRYNIDVFSVPRPEQVVLDNYSLELASRYLFGKSKDTQMLRQKAVMPLKSTGQASGSAMGFFDQGIITGLVAFVLPSLTLLGFVAYKIGRLGIKAFRP